MDISIITSLYRSENFLDTFTSHLLNVGSQVVKAGLSLELVIVVNDPSKYESDALSRLVAQAKTVFVVQVLSVSREPLYSSWNRGILASSGESIGFWNVDDVRTSEALIEGARRIKEGCQLIDFPYTLMKARNNLLGQHTGYKNIEYKAFPYDTEGYNPLDRLRTSPFFLFARSLYDVVGKFDSRFKIAGDFEWNVRASRVTKFCRGTAHGGFYYIHGGNISVSELLPVEENVVLLLFHEAHHWEGIRPASPELMRTTWEKWNSVVLPPHIQHQLWGHTAPHLAKQSWMNYRYIPGILRRPLYFFNGWGMMGSNDQRSQTPISIDQPRHPWVPDFVRRPLRRLISRTDTRELFATLGLVKPTAELTNDPNSTDSVNHTKTKVAQYLAGGRIPWSDGYEQYKHQYVDWVLHQQNMLELFRNKQQLPSQYGVRLDERVVEYPWIFTRLQNTSTMLLDAGSTLNQYFVLSKPLIEQKMTVIYTLSPETTYSSRKVSYIYGDLRHTILRDETFDEITCISTLEHIGMDNTMLYTEDKTFEENAHEDYILVLKEMNRILKPGGRFLLTVPFGVARNLNWIRQFDRALLQKAIDAFGGELLECTLYQYSADGWQLSDMEACANCEYFDVHTGEPFASDYAAAARAVACLLFVK